MNLFVFQVPRLSVDIDLDYVGSWSQNGMLEERPKIEKAIQDVLSRENFTVRRMPAELAAGKLSALLSRRRARDLFDSYKIFSMDNLDFKRLRIAFVVYGAMNHKDWRTVLIKDVDFDSAEIKNQLVPLLHPDAMQGSEETENYGNMLVEKCRQGLSTVLPFNDAEQAFLNLLIEKGEIDATILTSDMSLQERIQAQPLLQWKALNVRHHKKL